MRLTSQFGGARITYIGIWPRIVWNEHSIELANKIKTYVEETKVHKVVYLDIFLKPFPIKTDDVHLTDQG